MYDLIGDIHGYATPLKRLLSKMGYADKDGVWQHPKRKAIFVGDFIDRGPEIREVLHIVKKMIDNGHALAVMGNHEYNAIAYAHKNSDGNYLRSHNIVHTKQHQKTIDQFSNHSTEWNEWIEWFYELPLYLDLGEMPLVNNLCNSKEESIGCEKYPLAVQYFRESKLSCLTENVDPNLMFSQYSYKSGVVKAYAEHCDEMFGFVDTYLNLTENDNVLDVGGNDGTLLQTFLKRKSYLNVLNVDASENLTKLSEQKGVPTYNAFWGTETANKLNKKFKLITSTNVFQHTPPIVDFVEAISMSLEQYGIWCLEFPYWKTNMETKQYDQIYHEHVYFYLLELADNFVKLYTGSYGYKVQLNEVDALCWLDIDVTNKAVCIHNIRSIVCFVANNTEVCDTTTTLNVTQEWLYKSLELSASERIVELEQSIFGCCSNRLF